MNLLTSRTKRHRIIICAIVAVCLVATIAPFVFSAQFLAFADMMIRHAERGHFALPAAIIFFTIASFVGAPQPLLVGACVLAVGAECGFLYGWIATVVAAVVDYSLGHYARRFAVKSISSFARWRMLHAMRARPFLASLLIRNVPTVPFLVVNMGFGLARASFWRFLAGLVLGVAPKTAMVAFGLKAVSAAIAGNALIAIAAAAACVATALFGMALSRRFMRQDEVPFEEPEESPSLPPRFAGSSD